MLFIQHIIINFYIPNLFLNKIYLYQYNNKKDVFFYFLNILLTSKQ